MDKSIVCLKWGSKYSSQYVNVLYNMCKRHSTLPFNFVCLTDNPADLNSNIIVKTLPNLPIHGWWYKPYVFSKDLNLKGEVLFLDLDIIVHNNIDKLWSIYPNSFVIIRDFTRHMNPGWKKFNSSVFRFNVKNYNWVWEDFEKNFQKIISKTHGDQDYLYNILDKHGMFWPDDWIQSYKWEMRDKSDVSLIKGKRNFTSIKTPNLNPNCCIAVFHGEPNPHDVKDPWVIENWK